MKNRKGFALIELVAVVAIITIMTAVTIVSLQSGKTEKELEVAAREVVAAIREAQNSALAGKNASSTCAKYDFTYVADSADYSVGTVGGGGCPISNYTLSNGVIFGGGGTFSFSIPFGTVSSSSISIQLTKSSDNYYICVNSTGSVYEKKDGCP